MHTTRYDCRTTDSEQYNFFQNSNLRWCNKSGIGSVRQKYCNGHIDNKLSCCKQTASAWSAFSTTAIATYNQCSLPTTVTLYNSFVHVLQGAWRHGPRAVSESERTTHTVTASQTCDGRVTYRSASATTPIVAAVSVERSRLFEECPPLLFLPVM